jgi:2-polyprenyl-3-methyl-5-hydroxy-6-metoxy-1,4-benzoquinol methylase
MTTELAKHFKDLTCVDGAESFCASLRDRFPQARIVHSLFEEYEPNRKFDFVVLGHVLEHVDDPTSLLRRVSGWLHPGGKVLGSVPNARSIHRQMAVVMGLLETEYSLNDTDKHHGHRRVYDPETLRNDFLRAGLDIEVFGGYWLKPISNAQIEASWTTEMLEAAMQVGERYPDIAAEIYVVARGR